MPTIVQGESYFWSSRIVIRSKMTVFLVDTMMTEYLDDLAANSLVYLVPFEIKSWEFQFDLF